MIKRCCSSLSKSICFGRRRSDSNLSDDGDEEETNLEDLQLTPNKIDSNLEMKISQWQEAINDYKLYEDNFLELDDPRDDLRTIIKALRRSPQVFLSNTYSVNVRKLAEKKLLVNKLQKKLGLSKEMREAAALEAEGYTGPRSPTVGNTDDDNHSITVNPLNSSLIMRDSSINVSTKISVLWANRLNEINPTQGALQVQSPGTRPSVGDSNNRNSKKENNEKLGSLDLKIRPKWPDFLVDISFDVVKVNRFGHQMRRTLKLTQNHVISIKNGCIISKFYHFNEIRRTWLENGNTIRVQQRNDKHNIYKSPIAPHILQQIITRVQVRSSLDKTEFRGMITDNNNNNRNSSALSHVGGVHSSAAIASIIKNIAEENTLETEAVMATFANDLKMRTVRTISLDMRSDEDNSPAENIAADTVIEEGGSDGVAGEVMTVVGTLVEKTVSSATNEALTHIDNLHSSEQQFTDVILQFSESATTSAVESISRIQEDISKKPTQEVTATTNNSIINHNARKKSTTGGTSRERTASGMSASSSASNTNTAATPRFLNFKEGMPEFSAQKAVQGIIFDDASSEGNTRKLFIDKFTASSPTSCDGKAKLLEVRMFIDGMHEYILTHRGISLALLYEQEKQRSIIADPANSMGSNMVAKESDRLAKQRQLTKRTSLQFLKDNMDLSVVEESVLVFISFIIFIVVEEALFLPLRNQIISFLPSGGKMEEEHQLTAKMKSFCGRTQKQWGVPEDLVSPMGWQSAIFELAGVEHNLTPSSQLHILTRTVKAIYNEFKLVVLPRLEAAGKHDVYIGADDLVPIFLYVFCHAELRHPMRNRDLMWSLCHPDQLHGEGGYYLTVYESAIEFILNEPLASESFSCASSGGGSASRSSMTVNPLYGSVGTDGGSRGFDGIESISSGRSKQSSRPSRLLSGREKFLQSLASRLRGFNQFVSSSNSSGRGEDSQGRMMSSDYAMRESFY